MTRIRGAINNKTTINAHVTNGIKGLSAYEIWLNLGNVGTEGDFIDSIGASGGSGGTTNYNLLRNKPSISNVELEGNKSLEELGMKAITKAEIKNMF